MDTGERRRGKGEKGKEGKRGLVNGVRFNFAAFVRPQSEIARRLSIKKPIANNMAAKLLTVQSQGRSAGGKREG